MKINSIQHKTTKWMKIALMNAQTIWQQQKQKIYIQKIKCHFKVNTLIALIENVTARFLFFRYFCCNNSVSRLKVISFRCDDDNKQIKFIASESQEITNAHCYVNQTGFLFTCLLFLLLLLLFSIYFFLFLKAFSVIYCDSQR